MMFLLVPISCQKNSVQEKSFCANNRAYKPGLVFETHACNAGQDPHVCLPHLIISFGVEQYAETAL